MKRLFILLVLLTTSCAEELTNLEVINNSGYKIFYDFNFEPKSDSICQCFSHYTTKNDTSRIFFEGKYKYDGKYQTIAPNSKILTSSSWRRFLYRRDDNKMTITLFIADSLKEFTWDEMYGQKKWIKQYRFTEHELDSINWKIVFDGK